MAARVADPSERRRHNRPCGGRNQRSGRDGTAVPQPVRQRCNRRALRATRDRRGFGADRELAPRNTITAEFDEAAADPAGRAQHMAALEIKVRSLRDAGELVCALSGVRVEARRVIVPAAAVFNTTIVFSE